MKEDFKEKANQFFKENYGIEDKIKGNGIDSRLDFCNTLISLINFKEGSELNTIIDILIQEIELDEDKIIDLVYYEVEYFSGDLYWDWYDLLIDFDSYPETIKILNKRQKEVYDGPLAFSGDEKGSVKYCFQDFFKNKEKYIDFLKSILTEYLSDVLLAEYKYEKDKEDNLENFFKIML